MSWGPRRWNADDPNLGEGGLEEAARDGGKCFVLSRMTSLRGGEIPGKGRRAKGGKADTLVSNCPLYKVLLYSRPQVGRQTRILVPSLFCDNPFTRKTWSWGKGGKKDGLPRIPQDGGPKGASPIEPVLSPAVLLGRVGSSFLQALGCADPTELDAAAL